MPSTCAAQTLMTPPWQKTATLPPGWAAMISSMPSTTIFWNSAMSTPWPPVAMACQAAKFSLLSSSVGI